MQIFKYYTDANVLNVIENNHDDHANVFVVMKVLSTKILLMAFVGSLNHNKINSFLVDGILKY